MSVKLDTLNTKENKVSKKQYKFEQNEEKNYLLVNGSVPGNKGNIVKVQKAVKVNQ